MCIRDSSFDKDLVSQRLEAGLINLLKMAPDAMHGARQPGHVLDPAQAATEWYNVAAVLKKRAVRLQVETPYPKDLMPVDVWQSPRQGRRRLEVPGRAPQDGRPDAPRREAAAGQTHNGARHVGRPRLCLLYTSDAADDM
eukprot:14468257-Alexandrium_andersonii.AAC.1